jgi:hypothetical protein
MHIAGLKYHEKEIPVKDLIMISRAGKSPLPGRRVSNFRKKLSPHS